MNVADAVSGKDKLAGVRWLLFGREAQCVLQETLSMLLVDPATLGPCRLRRVRFKPGHKLTAYYDVSIQGHETRPVAVIWRGHRSAGWRNVREQIGGIECEARGRGLLDPFRALAAESSGWNLRIQVAPLDVEFPQLARVFDREFYTEKLRNIPDRYGEVSDESTAHSSEVRFFRYQPGLRHVLRYRRVNQGGTAGMFAKLSLSDESARAFRVSLQAGDWLASRGTSMTCVRPLAIDAENSAVVYPEIVGLPLSEFFQRPNGLLPSQLRWLGEALNLLHRLPNLSTQALPTHDFSGEIAEVRQASEFVQALLVDVGATIRALLDRAQCLHELLPQEPPTFIHKDLKVEHLIATKTALTLIDFETCCLGDPALDVGTFLADLRLCCFLYGLPGAEEAQNYFLEGYSSGALDGRLVRARLYEALALVKMTVRRVQLSDEHWTSQTEKLVGIARQIMERLQETLGLRTKRPSTKKSIDLSPSFADSRTCNDPQLQTLGGEDRDI